MTAVPATETAAAQWGGMNVTRSRPIVVLLALMLAACGGAAPAPTVGPAATATAAPATVTAAPPTAPPTATPLPPTAAPTAPPTLAPTAPPTLAPTEAPTPTTVSSADGKVSVELPAGIDASAITVDPVPEADRPKEVEVASRSVVPGAAYRLGPDGATFIEPVTVIVSLTRAELGLAAGDALPVLALATRSSEGVWEPLADPNVSEADGVILVSGTTTHFSDVYTMLDWLIWLFCVTVVHQPLGDYPSFMDLLIGLSYFYDVDELTVRFILAEGNDKFVHSDPMALDRGPVRVPTGITRYGEKSIIGVEIVRPDGEVVADLTGDLIGLGVRKFKITAEEGPLIGFGPCDRFPEP